MLLLKNPQFLTNDYETRSKFNIHEDRISVKHGHPMLDFHSSYAFIKNPQFLPNDCETQL